MQKTLYSLIELQEVDTRLDELMEERGDLPLIVEELQAKLDVKNGELKRRKEELKTSKVRQRELELLLDDLKEKLAKYEEQLYQVKTNKEYDAITVETDAVKENQTESENELLSISEKILELDSSIGELDVEVSKLKDELEEK